MPSLRLSRRALDGARARVYNAGTGLGTVVDKRYYLLIPLAYVLASYLVLAPDEGSLHSLAEKENSYFQLLGAFTFFVAGVLFVAAYLRARGEEHRARNPRVKRVAYLLLALAFFVATGEELSWGQHLAGYEPPAGLSEANSQNEANFHNLEALKGAPNQLFTAFWFGFTILVPLVALVSHSARARLERLMPIVPLAFGALFAINYAASKVAEALTPAGLHHSAVEIKESNFAVLFLVVALYVLVVELAHEVRAPSVAPRLAGGGPPLGLQK